MNKTLRQLCALPVFLGLSLAAHSVSAQNASLLTLGAPVSGTIAVAGEADWYSITTATIGDLIVTQTAWPPYIETRIAIFGPNSQTLAQASPVTAAAPGTYYIKVWSATNGVSVDVYTFTATLKQAETGNDIDGAKNSAAQAVPILLGATVSDTIAPSKETAGVQDIDWFTVTTDTVGDLTVTQTAWPPYLETRIAVFGPDSDTLVQSNPVLAAAPGKYFIKVWSSNDGSSIALYTFRCTLDKAKTGNDIDKGANTSAGAVPVTLGAIVTDAIAPSKVSSGKQDIDWFTLTTETVGDLTITQTEWPPYLETRIAVFGPNSDTLVQSNPVRAAAPGKYFIKVWSFNDGSSIAPYTFTSSLEQAKTGNDMDKGANTATGAVPIVIGTAISDTIAPSAATAGKQDVDWFTVTTTAVGDISVTQTAWPPYIETRIAIFGPNSETVVQNNPVTKAAPGTYYFKVWSATDGSSIAPYTFTVNHTGSPIDAGMAPGQPDAGVPVDALNHEPKDSGNPDGIMEKIDGVVGDASAQGDASTPIVQKDAGAIDLATSNDLVPSVPIDSAKPPVTSPDSGSAAPHKPSESSGGGCSYTSVEPFPGQSLLGFALLGLLLVALRPRSKPRS